MTGCSFFQQSFYRGSNPLFKRSPKCQTPSKFTEIFESPFLDILIYSSAKILFPPCPNYHFGNVVTMFSIDCLSFDILT